MKRWIELLRDVLAAIATFFRKSNSEYRRQTTGERIHVESERKQVLRQRAAAELLEQLRTKNVERREDDQKQLDRGRRDHFDSDW